MSANHFHIKVSLLQKTSLVLSLDSSKHGQVVGQKCSGFADEHEKTTGVIYLDLCEVSDTVAHNILASTLEGHGFDE